MTIGPQSKRINGVTYYAHVEAGRYRIREQDLFVSLDGEVVRVRSLWIREKGRVLVNGDHILGFKICDGFMISDVWKWGVMSYLCENRGELLSLEVEDFLGMYKLQVMALPSQDRVFLMPLGGVVPIAWFK
jgi:hypothetical protein